MAISDVIEELAKLLIATGREHEGRGDIVRPLSIDRLAIDSEEEASPEAVGFTHELYRT